MTRPPRITRVDVASSWAALLAVAIASLIGASCGSGSGTDPGEVEPGTFLAFASDFSGYHTWTSFPAGTDPVPGSIHLLGPRTAYINRIPAHGSTELPVGTIIVKEVASGDPAMRDVIARVKRGGSYNADGARGWEWFELRNTADGGAVIVWRGVGPPVGGCSYLGTVGGGCNLCHAGSTDDESIQVPALRPSSF
jgi:hypothetical protein